MKTFALKNGDLLLTGDQYAMVEGAARVQQHLGLALREPFGSDRFAPKWGSTLPHRIGTPIGKSTANDVRAEVVRVIKNHMIVQNDQLRSRAMQGLSATLTASEVITQLVSVTIRQQQDTFIVKVDLATAGKQQITLLTSASGSA